MPFAHFERGNCCEADIWSCEKVGLTDLVWAMPLPGHTRAAVLDTPLAVRGLPALDAKFAIEQSKIPVVAPVRYFLRKTVMVIRTKFPGQAATQNPIHE